MAKNKKPSFTPATEFKTTKLPPNGPKPNQSTEAWQRGKQKADDRWDKVRTKNLNKIINL